MYILKSFSALIRRITFVLFGTIVLFCCISSAQAATGVPEEVLTAANSVVFIENSKGSGSGFVIRRENGETLIATNHHVVADDPGGVFVWLTETRTADAEVVFAIPEKDLSVIRIYENGNISEASLSLEDAQRGEAVYAVGFPGAGNILSETLDHTSEAATITDGIISAVRTHRFEDSDDTVKILQMNAAINGGNSGGPLFNAEGEVVGINTFTVLMDSQGVFGAVAVSELWNLLQEYGIDIPEEKMEAVETEPVNETKPVQENTDAKQMAKVPMLICFGILLVSITTAVCIYYRKKSAPKKKIKTPPQPRDKENFSKEKKVRHIEDLTITMTSRGKEEKKENSRVLKERKTLDKSDQLEITITKK